MKPEIGKVAGPEECKQHVWRPKIDVVEFNVRVASGRPSSASRVWPAVALGRIRRNLLCPSVDDVALQTLPAGAEGSHCG